MSDNAEAGIALTQAKAAQAEGSAGLKKYHDGSVVYLNERILVAVMAISLLGLMILWATVTSDLVRYGSLAGVILLTFLWGLARIKRLEAIKQQRAQQAESWQSDE
jgi:hypothetical protein